MNSHRWFAALALSAFIPHDGEACCAVGRLGEPVVNADQSVLLIWDPATKTEHFIRKASFKADGHDFGFLVPTPSRPELSESGNEAFPYLANLTRPPGRSYGGDFGCSAADTVTRSAAVTVVERREVAGFDAHGAAHRPAHSFDRSYGRQCERAADQLSHGASAVSLPRTGQPRGGGKSRRYVAIVAALLH